MKKALAYLLTIASIIIFASIPSKANDVEAGVWKDLKQLVFKDKTIEKLHGIVKIKAPYRATDDRRVPVGVSAKLKPGQSIKEVTIIIDENPMPVSATVTMEKRRTEFEFSTFMRFNGPSPLRVVLETDDGKFYMSETYVKTSGLGACASPPVGNPDELLADIGKMELFDKPKKEATRLASQSRRDAHLKIKHPNLTGLQLDQITLRYILARFVKTIEVSQGNEKLFSVRGGISISQNPEISFDYLSNGSNELKFDVTDTDKTNFKQSFPINLGS